MRMTRTFQPVGQGAYFTEQFVKDDGSGINIVYDCGSDSLRIQDLESVIRASFKKSEEVDAVFISHFDNDHVNGLPILLNWCRVKKIVLPVVSSRAEIAYWRFKSNIALDKKEGFEFPMADRLLDQERSRPEKMFEGMRVIEMPSIERISEVTSVDEAVEGNVSEVTPVRFDFGLSGWVFVPFNFKRFDREADFRDVFEESLVAESVGVDLEDFITNAADVFRRIGEDKSKKLFRAINRNIRQRLREKGFRNRFGSINGNSMTLYSGEMEESGRYRFSLRCGHDMTWYRAGCLYTGDYEAKDATAYAELENFYVRQNCWAGVGCVQLPHHGSRHNYNQSFDSNERCYVASFGLGNRNHHPGRDVIVGLLKNDRKVILSTEANYYSHRCDICQRIG